MGTRNLTKVIDKDGVIRVAQYGQWDGYPEYSGRRVLEFISEYGMLDKIENSLGKCRFGTEDEVNAVYNAWNEHPLANEYGAFALYYPSLARDTGVDILKTIVYSNNDILLTNEAEFENDDLFCEGVYTLDFKQRLFISKFNGAILIHEFDQLPTVEEYLNSFEKVLTPTA